MSEILYDCRWSNAVDDKFISDFIATEDAVFKGNYTKEFFLKKYVNNIFGRSVVVVVYLDGKPVAARGLWRNDIEGKEAYQPGDTCVTEICRGKGIFTEMTKRSVAMLPSDAVVYNFPNQNSYPGYIKMGWRLVGEYGIALFSAKAYLKEHSVKMDRQYADWWLPQDDGIQYIKRRNDYFLVRSMGKPLCYRVVAAVEKETAERFQKASWGIYFYRSLKKTFYNRKLGMPLHIVAKNTDIEQIPLWKIDVI